MRHRGARFFVTLFAGIVAAGCATGRAPAPLPIVPASARSPIFSPYKHVATGWQPDTRVVSTTVAGGPVPIVANGRSNLPRSVSAITLAFATGECGVETWDGADPSDVVAQTIPALVAAGIGYIVSTGGEAGTFTCASDAAMEAFVARYDSPELIGFDFDIERGQSDDVLRNLVHAVRSAQARRPWLRISFTLATWAASDGSQRSLNPDGARVLSALRAARVGDHYINLMVMDYGDANSGNCVVAGDVCDMGRSAIQAAMNLHDRFGVPLARIELTPMIGVNDVTANVFNVDDVATLARFAQESGLAGVHFWSLDRDVSCPENRRIVSSTCHGLPALEAFSYTRAFAEALP